MNSDMYETVEISHLFCFGSVRSSFAIVFLNEWPCHGATRTVHKYTTVSVKIAGTLYCLLALPMLGYKTL